MKYLGNIDIENANYLIRYYEEKIVSKPVENMIVICSNGDVYHSIGSKKSVMIDDTIDLCDSIVTHNHPQEETSFSFSGQDLGLFFEEGIKILRGVDYKYSYTIEKTSDTIEVDADSIRSEFESIRRLELMSLSMNGSIDVDEDGFDYINSVLSKKYNFLYRREKR